MSLQNTPILATSSDEETRVLLVGRCLVCQAPVMNGREALAAYAHEAWAAYMGYFLGKCTPVADGLLIPTGYVGAIQAQIDTPYADLLEIEKELDREEADKIARLASLPFDGWCPDCGGRALASLLALRDASPELLGVRVAWLRDQGAPFLASIVCGPVPFDAGDGPRPSPEELARLTYE